MFDQLRGMASMASMMKDLPRLKAKLGEVKERLAGVRVEAKSGGGAVRATADGHLRLVSLRIDPGVLSALAGGAMERDRAAAEALVVEAVNAALAMAREAAGAEVARAAESIGIPLPPGALEGLLS